MRRSVSARPLGTQEVPEILKKELNLITHDNVGSTYH
jgi:hypothetical protein